MMTEPSRDSLEHDINTVVLGPRRFSCSIECTGASRLLDRAGVTSRQWQHRGRYFIFPLRDMPAVIARAEKDRRLVLIEDGDQRVGSAA